MGIGLLTWQTLKNNSEKLTEAKSVSDRKTPAITTRASKHSSQDIINNQGKSDNIPLPPHDRTKEEKKSIDESQIDANGGGTT